MKTCVHARATGSVLICAKPLRETCENIYISMCERVVEVKLLLVVVVWVVVSGYACAHTRVHTKS